MNNYKIAAIPGDGIGVEVIAAGVEVLQALAAKRGSFGIDFEHFDWGSERYLREGQYIPAGGLEKLKAFDAIFFGAVGSQEVPDHVSLWGLRLRSARASISSPTCARPVCCRGWPAHWPRVRRSTG